MVSPGFIFKGLYAASSVGSLTVSVKQFNDLEEWLSLR